MGVIRISRLVEVVVAVSMGMTLTACRVGNTKDVSVQALRDETPEHFAFRARTQAEGACQAGAHRVRVKATRLSGRVVVVGTYTCPVGDQIKSIQP